MLPPGPVLHTQATGVGSFLLGSLINPECYMEQSLLLQPCPPTSCSTDVYNISNTHGKVEMFCNFKTVYKIREDVIGTFNFLEGEVLCLQVGAGFGVTVGRGRGFGWVSGRREHYSTTVHTGPSAPKLGAFVSHLYANFNWNARTVLLYMDRKTDNRPYYFTVEGVYQELQAATSPCTTTSTPPTRADPTPLCTSSRPTGTVRGAVQRGEEGAWGDPARGRAERPWRGSRVGSLRGNHSVLEERRKQNSPWGAARGQGCGRTCLGHSKRTGMQ